MATISKEEANNCRSSYRNTTFGDQPQNRQKNLEAVLFDVEDLQNLITRVKDMLPSDAEGKKYLKAFLVYREGYINLCMTGGARAQNNLNPNIGKPEVDIDLNNDTFGDVVLGLPCPPHCGQGGLAPDGTTGSNKYVIAV